LSYETQIIIRSILYLLVVLNKKKMTPEIQEKISLILLNSSRRFEWIVIGRALLLSVSREELSRWDLLYITNMTIKFTHGIVLRPRLANLNWESL